MYVRMRAYCVTGLCVRNRRVLTKSTQHIAQWPGQQYTMLSRLATNYIVQLMYVLLYLTHNDDDDNGDNTTKNDPHLDIVQEQWYTGCTTTTHMLDAHAHVYSRHISYSTHHKY
jgi:hypothetical protein